MKGCQAMPDQAIPELRIDENRSSRKKLKITCGARNRQGQPCQCKLLFKSGRCRFHGGLSTGPKTPEGMARTLAALAQAREMKKLGALTAGQAVIGGGVPPRGSPAPGIVPSY